jgi:hypothetical protein
MPPGPVAAHRAVGSQQAAPVRPCRRLARGRLPRRCGSGCELAYRAT